MQYCFPYKKAVSVALANSTCVCTAYSIHYPWHEFPADTVDRVAGNFYPKEAIFTGETPPQESHNESAIIDWIWVVSRFQWSCIGSVVDYAWSARGSRSYLSARVLNETKKPLLELLQDLHARRLVLRYRTISQGFVHLYINSKKAGEKTINRVCEEAYRISRIVTGKGFGFPGSLPVGLNQLKKRAQNSGFLIIGSGGD